MNRYVVVVKAGESKREAYTALGSMTGIQVVGGHDRLVVMTYETTAQNINIGRNPFTLEPL